jgi:DNA-binding IclR family transcriptional regulator
MAHVPAERCLSIIQLLADNAGEMPLGEIADRLKLPKSGAHRLLATLVKLGWAEQDPQTGFYRLTMRLAILGQQFYTATRIPDICQPILDRLATHSREFVRLAVVDTDSLVWVAHAQGAKGGLMYQPSLATNTVPLYATASGKAWLATLPPETIARMLRKNGGFADADRYGPNVVRSMEAFGRKLDTTRRRGYGVAISEAEPGVAVAAAIRSGQDGPVVATVSVAGPGLRMPDQRVRDLAPAVIAAAGELSALWPLRLHAARRLGHGNAARHRAA